MISRLRTYKFILPQYQYIMIHVANVISHLNGVYAYYVNKDNVPELYYLDQDNTIVSDISVCNANKDACDAFCEKKMEIEWCTLSEIPFLAPRLQLDNKHNILQPAKAKTPDIMHEAERTNLCVRINHPYDNVPIVYVVCFRQDAKHWDSIAIQNKEEGFNQTHKTVLQSVVCNVIRSTLNTMLYNRNIYSNEWQINTDMLQMLQQKAAAQHKQLRTLLYRKATLAVPQFFDYYTIDEDTDQLLIQYIDHPAIKDVFVSIHNYMLSHIVMHQQTEQKIQLDKQLCKTVLHQHIEQLDTQHQNDKQNNVSKATVNKDMLSRYDKLIGNLNKWEEAAEILVSKNERVTAANLIKEHPDHKHKDEGERPSEASISMYLKDNKHIISKLFREDPDNTKWSVLRAKFLNLRKLDESVKAATEAERLYKQQMSNNVG